MKAPHWKVIFLFLVPCASWTLFLLAFWPGMMSLDSIDQWIQAATGAYVDLHPAFYAFTIRLVTILWNTPAAVALLQIVALSSVVAWGLSSLLKATGGAGALSWGSALVAGIFAISPVAATTVITLWKDVPYAVCILALSILFLQLGLNDGAGLARRSSPVILGLLCAGIMLYRHNGLPVALGALLALLVVYRRHWRPIAIALAISLGLWQGVRGPLYQRAGVISGIHAENQFMVHQIAAHLKAGTPLSAAQRELLNQLRPLAGGWPYNCYTHAPTSLTGELDLGLLFRDTTHIRSIYLDTLRRAPRVNLAHVLCSSSLIWQVRQPADGYLATFAVFETGGQVQAIVPNPVLLKTQSRLPRLAARLFRYLVVTNRALIWRPALYLYLAVLLTSFLAVRLRRSKLLLYVLPVLLQSLVMAPINLTQEARYQFPVYLVCLFALSFLFIRPVPPEHPAA